MGELCVALRPAPVLVHRHRTFTGAPPPSFVPRSGSRDLLERVKGIEPSS
jgi:hypothetical protein